MTDGETDRRTDGWTDRGENNLYPHLVERTHNNRKENR